MTASARIRRRGGRRVVIVVAATLAVAAAAVVVVVLVRGGRPDAPSTVATTGLGRTTNAESTPTPSSDVTSARGDTPDTVRVATPPVVALGEPRTAPAARDVTSWRPAEWSASLPSTTPERFTGAIEHVGPAVFSADGALITVLREHLDDDCLYAPPSPGRGGWLYFAAEGYYGSSGDESCEFVPYAITDAGEFVVVPGSAHQSWGAYVTVDAQGSYEVRFTMSHTDGQPSFIDWFNGPTRSAVRFVLPPNGALSAPVLSPAGRVATTERLPTAPYRILLFEWGEDLENAVRLSAPGGPACHLSAADWYDAPDSTGSPAELLVAVQACRTKPAAWEWRVVVLDPWRAEVLWTGAPLPEQWGNAPDACCEQGDPWDLAVGMTWRNGVAIVRSHNEVAVMTGDDIRRVRLHDPSDQYDCVADDGWLCHPGHWLPDGWTFSPSDG